MRFPFRACNNFTSFENLILLLLPALKFAGPPLLSPSGIRWVSLMCCEFELLALILSCYLIALLFNMHSCPHLNNLSCCCSFFKALQLYSYSYAHTFLKPLSLAQHQCYINDAYVMLSLFLLAEHLPSLFFLSLGLRAPQQITYILLSTLFFKKEYSPSACLALSHGSGSCLHGTLPSFFFVLGLRGKVLVVEGLQGWLP